MTIKRIKLRSEILEQLKSKVEAEVESPLFSAKPILERERNHHPHESTVTLDVMGLEVKHAHFYGDEEVYGVMTIFDSLFDKGGSPFSFIKVPNTPRWGQYLPKENLLYLYFIDGLSSFILGGIKTYLSLSGIEIEDEDFYEVEESSTYQAVETVSGMGSFLITHTDGILTNVIKRPDFQDNYINMEMQRLARKDYDLRVMTLEEFLGEE